MGILVHFFTDWYNDVKIWTPFRLNMEHTPELYNRSVYQQEIRTLDYRLFLNNSDQLKVWEYLRNGKCISIPNVVVVDEMEKMRESILNEQFNNRKDIPEYSFRYVNEQIENQFINTCIEYISSYLKGAFEEE